MQTPEEAKAVGEKLKQILLHLALAHDDVMGMLDGPKSRAKLAEHIEATIKFVREQIRPAYSKSKLDSLLYEQGRAARTFQSERNRLWDKAFRICSRDVTRFAGPELEKFLEDPAHASILEDLRREQRKQIETFTIPRLEKLKTPGDDFLLYTYAMMIGTEEKAAIENIADTGRTPVDQQSAYFGMFGLLIEATRAEKLGDMDCAYSYLIDACHLIGMCESARYVMRLLPKVAKKSRAKINSEKSREQVNKAKLRAYELFNVLRPHSADGKPQHWRTANVAADAIWATLESEANDDGRSDPGVSFNTVQQLCRRLHNVDKDGGILDIRVEVVQRLPDGTERNISID